MASKKNTSYARRVQNAAKKAERRQHRQKAKQAKSEGREYPSKSSTNTSKAISDFKKASRSSYISKSDFNITPAAAKEAYAAKILRAATARKPPAEEGENYKPAPRGNRTKEDYEAELAARELRAANRGYHYVQTDEELNAIDRLRRALYYMEKREAERRWIEEQDQNDPFRSNPAGSWLDEDF